MVSLNVLVALIVAGALDDSDFESDIDVPDVSVVDCEKVCVEVTRIVAETLWVYVFETEGVTDDGLVIEYDLVSDLDRVNEGLIAAVSDHVRVRVSVSETAAVGEACCVTVSVSLVESVAECAVDLLCDDV